MARAANDLVLSSEQRTLLRTAISERVSKPNAKGCELWVGATNIRTGTPVMMLKGQHVNVTRAVFLLKSKKTELSGDTSIKTKCGRPNCLNPDHLVGVARRFQMLPLADAVAKSASLRSVAAAKAGAAKRKEKPLVPKAETAKPKGKKKNPMKDILSPAVPAPDAEIAAPEAQDIQ